MSDPDLLRDPTDAPHTPPRAAPIRRSPPPLERLSTAIPPPRTAQSRNGGNSTETESAQPPPFAMPTSLPATSPPRRIDSARPTDSPPRTPAVSAVLPMPPSSSTVAAAASRRTLAHRVPPRTPAAPTGASTILAINPFAARGRGPITPTVAARIAAHQRQGDAVRRRLDMISGVPTRVLDAPGICDDYYLNLLDWSSRGIIAVALGASVYLWSSQTAAVSRILDLEPEGDTVTSLKWAGRGHYLAIGTAAGLVHLIDSSTGRRVRTFRQNTTPLSRVGVLAWCGDQIYAGTKDARIEQWDHRAPDRPAAVLAAHRVEVCGLQWSPDLAMLASGGNDNRAYIWDPRKSTTSNAVGPVTASPLYVLAEHKAAVKAMAWSPHHSGVLVTGGGTADQTIRVWNLRASQPLQQQNPSSGSSQQQPIALRSVHTVHTGSQVCNLLWSRTSKTEIVSTHGYSEHAISLWEYDPASPGNMAAAAAAAGERAMHGQQYQQQQQQRRRATLPRLGIPTLSTLNSSTPTGGMVIAQPDGSPEMVGCPPRQLTSVTGHSSRVLYASLSPDGTCLATAAGDETLRIWRMFPAASSSDSIAAAAATPVASSVVAEWGSASRRSGPAPLLR
ncbi:WD40-repeat-containing domain protein [Blastocladiella britannica]|nr:WD40-repeat-containing domain protein [Blastocladiella britannica]